MPLRDERATRLTRALLANIDDWEARCLEIAEHANPGNKVRALSLARDIGMVRHSLRRLAGLGGDE